VCSPGAVNGYQSRTRDEEDEEVLGCCIIQEPM
jgi:hypothetical protein